MPLIQTKNFSLATYAQGDPNSSKLAIVIPGRLDSKDYAHMREHVDFLASRGYYALSFDPPGTWESPGDISLYSTTNSLKATNELIAYFGNKPTILVGHSRGGTNAMLAGMTSLQVTHFVAVMSHHGPTKVDLPKAGHDVVTSHRDIPPGTIRTTEQKEFVLPISYFKDQLQYDALEGLKQSVKPKLFFYGMKDALVTPDTVREAYQVAAEPKMIHELNSEHDYRLHPEVIAEVNATIGKFLDRYQ